MTWLSTLLKALVGFASLVAAGEFIRPLSFHPKVESTLTKSLLNHWDLHLEELEIVLNGVDWWTGFTLDTELAQQIVVTDTYLALNSERPTALDRSFDSASQNLEITSGSTRWGHTLDSVSSTTELEGKVVQFRWNGDAYATRFEPQDRSVSDALLEGLTEDMDLRVLLPSEGARVGDEWEVDVACLPEILSPGGYFAWTIQPGESAPAWSSFLDPALMGELRPVLGAMLEGHVTVKYAGHDAGYSQLELSVDVHSTQNLGDLEDLAAQIIAEFPDWGTVEISRLDLDFALQAKGAAEWNTTSGHIFDLALKGSLESELDLELVWDAGSGWCVEVRTAVSGAFEQSFDTE